MPSAVLPTAVGPPTATSGGNAVVSAAVWLFALVMPSIMFPIVQSAPGGGHVRRRGRRSARLLRILVQSLKIVSVIALTLLVAAASIRFFDYAVSRARPDDA